MICGRCAAPRLATIVVLALTTTSCSWLNARRLDLQDCFPVAVGVGGGLTADAQVTDWMSPGVGFVSYTVNAGWLDRGVRGWWEESDVITTPRIAYEVFSEDYRGESSEQLGDGGLLTNLALQSLNLPNERWIRNEDGRLSVEYFALFNFFGERLAAGALTGLMKRDREAFEVRERTIWERDTVGAGVTVGFVHVRAGWSFLQTIDFLAGLVGLDPAGDDPGRVNARDPRPLAFPPEHDDVRSPSDVLGGQDHDGGLR